MTRFLRVSAILLASLVLTNCAGYQVGRAKAQYNKKLNPLIGQTQEVVLMEMGAPDSQDSVAGMEVWHYRQSYGSRGSASITPNQYGIYGGGKTWEAYDEINIYFKDGLMVKWDGYVQR